ncbi:MAG: hypothetical protein Faunusvirus6_8 [Faunusvirus sp.]|jgi:hypothetical protein|uniref:Uncharacterized protein n=1 Tax=Faunusvirus sp. TaxID=2487766 RepID=A0A3G4ZWK7_9VIRU|nr:MAG: hypothetical protein Faunusvirus6_8 [Faunusvirus sp.]
MTSAFSDATTFAEFPRSARLINDIRGRISLSNSADKFEVGSYAITGEYIPSTTEKENIVSVKQGVTTETTKMMIKAGEKIYNRDSFVELWEDTTVDIPTNMTFSNGDIECRINDEISTTNVMTEEEQCSCMISIPEFGTRKSVSFDTTSMISIDDNETEAAITPADTTSEVVDIKAVDIKAVDIKAIDTTKPATSIKSADVLVSVKKGTVINYNGAPIATALDNKFTIAPNTQIKLFAKTRVVIVNKTTNDGIKMTLDVDTPFNIV